MVKLKVLGICGSLRRESANFGLLKYAQENAPADLEIKLTDLTDVPFYNADLLTVPRPAQKLKDDIAQADALLLACPEYNYSIAPALKNALDWTSRAPDNHLLAGKPAAIPGAGGEVWEQRGLSTILGRCVYFSTYTC